MFPNPYLPIDLERLKEIRNRIYHVYMELEELRFELNEMIKEEETNRKEIKEEEKKLLMGFRYNPNTSPEGECGC